MNIQPTTLTLEEIADGAVLDVDLSDGGSLQLRPLSIAHVCDLYVAHGPAIRRAFEDAAETATVADILSTVPGFVPAVIARAAGEPDAVEDAAALAPATQREILEHVVALTLGEDEVALPASMDLGRAAVGMRESAAKWQAQIANLFTAYAALQVETVAFISRWRERQAATAGPSPEPSQ